MSDEHPSDAKRAHGRQLAIEGILRSRIFKRPCQAATEAMNVLGAKAGSQSGASSSPRTRSAVQRKRPVRSPRPGKGAQRRGAVATGNGWPLWMKVSMVVAAVLLLVVVGGLLLQEDEPLPNGVPPQKQTMAPPESKEPKHALPNENRAPVQAQTPVPANPNPPPRQVGPPKAEPPENAGNYRDVAVVKPPPRKDLPPPMVGTAPPAGSGPDFEPGDGGPLLPGAGSGPREDMASSGGRSGGTLEAGAAPGMGSSGGAAPNPVLERELAWTVALAAKAPPAAAGGGVVGGNAAKLQAAREASLRALSFRLQIPERLPGDYRLVAVVSKEARDGVMLSYMHNGDRILVFLNPSVGPDMPFEAVGVGDRILLAARKGGLRIAIEEGVEGPAEQMDYEAWSGLFVK